MKAYAETNPKTKKAFKELVANGDVNVHLPHLGTFKNGENVVVCGPHYPEMHRWYASVEVDTDGLESGDIGSGGIKSAIVRKGSRVR